MSLSSDKEYHDGQCHLRELAEWLWSNPNQWAEWPNPVESAAHMEQIMHAANTGCIEALRVKGMGSTVIGVKRVGHYLFQHVYRGIRLVWEVKYVPDLEPVGQ